MAALNLSAMESDYSALYISTNSVMAAHSLPTNKRDDSKQFLSTKKGDVSALSSHQKSLCQHSVCPLKRVMAVLTFFANKSDGSTRLSTKKREGVAHLIHLQE
jgi:hypothetical protein